MLASQHKTQYFEMFGNRGIYDQGWVAAARHGRLPWERVSKANFDKDHWELYNIDEDFSEANNLAQAEPRQARSNCKSLFLAGSTQISSSTIGRSPLRTV